MKTKVFLFLMLTALMCSGAAQAETVLVVSDCYVPGVEPTSDHNDDSLVAWLTDLGLTVDTTGMRQAGGAYGMRGNWTDGSNPAAVAAVAACDMIFVSRRTISGEYNNPNVWRDVAKPILLQSSYLSNNGRWDWHDSGHNSAEPPTSTDMTVEAGQAGHPFLAGLTGPVKLFDWTAAPTPGQWPKTVHCPADVFVPGSTLVGRFGDTDQQPILADIPPGTELAQARGPCAERRVFFSHWGYDDGPAGTNGPGGTPSEWEDYITDDYKTVLSNIIGDILGISFARKLKPSVDAGPDQVIVLPDTQTTLAAEIEDDGDPNGRLNYWWEVVSQPDGSTISGLNLNPLTITIPGTVEPNTLYPVTPTVTIDKVGVYELKLTARDEESDTNDTVKITVWNPSPVAEPNLVIYYSFDEGINTTVHDTGEGIYEPNATTFDYDGPYTDYHLTTYSTQSGIGNDPNWGPGPTTVTAPIVSGDFNFGTAMFFDPDFNQAAIHDHSLINPDNDYLDDFTECTIMMWIKSSEIDTSRGFIIFADPSGNDQRGARYDAVGGSSDPDRDRVLKGGFGYGTSSNESDERETSENTQTTDWQHVALVWKMGEAMKWYINSVEDTNLSDDTPIDQPLALYEKIIVGRGGKDDTDPGGEVGLDYGWHGWVDEVKIFQRALTQAQIQQEAHIVDSNPVITVFPSNQTLVQETAGVDTLALDVTVEDILGDYTVTWSQLSGPGTVGFDPTVSTEDVTLDFENQPWGMYHIQMEAVDVDPGGGSDVDDFYVFWQEKVQYSTDKDTPMALWKLDVLDTGPFDILDDTAHNLDGQTVNEPNLVLSELIANSLRFYNNAANQDNQSVDLNSVPGVDNLTVMFWMKAAEVLHMVPIDKLPNDDSGTGWNIKLRNDGAVWLQIGSEDTNHTFVESTAGAYAVDTWVHVAATFDDASNTGKLFINGLRVAQDTGITQTAKNLLPPMQMGQASEAQTGEKYRGQLDQVRLYDIALSDFEVAQIALEDLVAIEDTCQPDRWPEQAIASDISGPEGVPDCNVDLYDYGKMAGNWLKCTDLNNPSCWP